MRAQSVFLSGIVALTMYNIVYVSMFPIVLWSMTFGAVMGFTGAVATSAVVAGLRAFGTGLADASIKIIFAVAVILTLIFQIEVPISGLPIGLGLGSNLVNSFGTDTYIGQWGWLFANVFVVMVCIAGIIMVAGANTQ